MQIDDVLSALDPKNGQCFSCKKFYCVETTDELLLRTGYPRIKDNGDDDCFTCGWTHDFCYMKTQQCNISIQEIEESYNNQYLIKYDHRDGYIFKKRKDKKNG